MAIGDLVASASHFWGRVARLSFGGAPQNLDDRLEHLGTRRHIAGEI